MSNHSESLKEELEKKSAADVADLVLSPFVHPQLLLEICAEAGPTNWVVNRSDVYDYTLEILLKHPSKEVSTRAAEKLKIRRSTLHSLTPPEPIEDYESVKDYEVEDILGHPLCPFDAMLFFGKSLKDDHRVSAALSLTRRVLEYPPNWELNPIVRPTLSQFFGHILKSDPSPSVRSYAARIPLLSKEDLHSASEKETHIFVLGRILQNPKRSVEQLEDISTDQISREDFVANILALDHNLPQSCRNILSQRPTSKVNELIHHWYSKTRT